MTFAELARRECYPVGRELVVRELCRATFASARVDELCVAAREASRHVRSLAGSVDADRRARTAALDASCVADELVILARLAKAGVGRG